MIRILYCGMDNKLGGIESFVINVYRHFDKSKLQIDFLKITDTIYYEEELLDNGSKIYKIPSRKNNPALFYLELIKFFKTHKEYKIIHHHLNSCSSIDPLIIAKLFSRKTIAHSHNEYKGNKVVSRILHGINKKILPCVSDINLACSVNAGKSMFNKTSFQVVNNGIDVKKYVYNQAVRESIRNELNISGKIVIGHIGSFKYQKNHEFLIDVFKEVDELNPNCVLMLIGEGHLREKIEMKVRELHLSDKVVFTGLRNDTSDLLQAMDLFLFPSRYEGLGIVLIEAQSSGLKAIVSEKVPNDAIITNLVSVVNLDHGPKKWAQAINESLQKDYAREDTYDVILNNGYDSYHTSKLLESIYFDL